MAKLPLLHYEKDKTTLINTYYLALLPLLLFGLYKNGIKLYLNDLLSFKNIFIPLYFYLISIVISILVAHFFKESKNESIITSLIIVSTISLNTNMLIYPILLFVLLFITNYLNTKITRPYSSTSLIRLFLVLGLLINSYSYLNIGEKLAKFNYNLFDIFCGFGFGGIASTSTIILIFSLIVLSLNKFYKSLIPLSASFFFIVITFILKFLTHDLNSLDLILTGSTYFSFIFIAPDLYISPFTKKGHLIYGSLIGIITGIISLFNYYEAPFISIIICSFLIPVINKYTTKICSQ